jgi:Uma2 family endonuclease
VTTANAPKETQMSATYGLEYALFFGVPGNKIELYDGTSHWGFPFLSREEAETHFHEWLETIRRWKQIERPFDVEKTDRTWSVESDGIHVKLFPRPIRIRIPIEWEAFEAFLDTFDRRDFWPGQPEGLETGWDSWMDNGDIGMNLWSSLSRLSARHGGKHCSRSDIALVPWAGVAPDAYYYCSSRSNIMLADYFGAAPDLIAEVLSAPSRWLDRGLRMDVYRRAGVPHLWLVEPANETVEVYEHDGHYKLIGDHGPGESFGCPLFPSDKVSVNAIFDTQSKRKGWRNADDDDEQPDPIPEWIIPPEMKIGLEYFFHLGHPERRWEFWDNKARSVLAFGSSAEARARLDYFLTEACRC